MKKSKALMAAFGAAVLSAGTTAVTMSTHAFGVADKNHTGSVSNVPKVTGGSNTASAESNDVTTSGIHTGSKSVVGHTTVGGTQIKSQQNAGKNKTATQQKSPATGGSIRIHF